MCCGCAGWQPSGTRDTPLISCIYLLVWETGAVGENMGEGIQVLYGVYVYVQVWACLLCMVLLWKELSPGFSIYIFINHRSHWEGGIEESFKCKHAFSACTQHAWQSLTDPLQYTSHYTLPPTHTTCSSDCLPGRPDSGQLIFSSTHRSINTKTPHYSGLMQNNPGKQVRCVTIQATFSSYSLVWTRRPLCIPLFHLYLLSFSLQAANWSDTLKGRFRA